MRRQEDWDDSCSRVDFNQAAEGSGKCTGKPAEHLQALGADDTWR